MPLELTLNEEVAEVLNASIREAYQEALEVARRDGGLKEYYSIKEACAYLGVSRNTLTNNYIERGLPTYRVGNAIYVKRTEINNFLESHRV